MATFRYWKWTWTGQKGGPGADYQVADMELRLAGSSVAWPVGTTITATGGTGWNEPSEGVANLIDNNQSTKTLYLDFGATGVPQVTIDAQSAVNADAFRYRTANDATIRDPISWTLHGANASDFSDAVLLHTGSGETITDTRHTWTQDFTLASGVVYSVGSGLIHSRLLGGRLAR